MIRVGSLFSGIGGFEYGMEAAFGHNLQTIWQVEKDPFCQEILKKHWPNTIILDDVKKVNKNTVQSVDILIGGFPCQSISIAGNKEGLKNEEKSGLWWEMFRIISDLNPRIVVLENVRNILRIGGVEIIGALTKIGYCCEWTIVRASDFGAPHQRARWFCIAYTKMQRPQTIKNTPFKKPEQFEHSRSDLCENISDADTSRSKQFAKLEESMGEEKETQTWKPIGCRTLYQNEHKSRRSHWPRCEVEPILLGMDDGIPNWMDRNTKREHNKRIKALGNAIVPACSEYIGKCILNSGLVDDLLEDQK